MKKRFFGLLFFYLFLYLPVFICAQEPQEQQQSQRSVDELIQDLRSSDHEIRGEAAFALRQMGYEAHKAAPDLFGALGDYDATVRLEAVNALGNFGKYSKTYVPALFSKATLDVDPVVRLAAGRALGKLGGYAEEAVEDIMKTILESGDLFRSRNAAFALAHMEKYTRKQTKKLINIALTDKAPHKRQYAADAIRTMSGEHAERAISAFLDEALNPSILANKGYAIEALKKMEGLSAMALPRLEEALNNSDDTIRMQAVDVLERIALHVEEAMPLLRKSLKDSSANVKNAALYAIQHLGYRALDALPEVTNILLKDDDWVLRIRALETLGEIGWAAGRAIPSIQEAANKDLVNATFAAQIIEKIRDTLPEGEARNIDHLEEILRNTLYRTDLPSMCSVLCGLVQHSSDWTQDAFYRNPDYEMSINPWDFALESLGALFVSKASSFCPAAKEKINVVIQELTHDIDNINSCPTPSEFRNLKNLSATILQTVGLPDSSPVVYSKQFFSLLLRDILKDPTLTAIQKNKLTGLLDKADRSLTSDIRVARAARDQNLPGQRSNSLFNTYALATSILASKEKTEGIPFLKEAINSDDPLRIAYSPSYEADRCRRASAARAVPVHLALYQSPLESLHKEEHRQNLLDSLSNYIHYLPSLMAHLQRSGTHRGDDAIAPYYIYSTIPYVTSATQLLLEENNPGERELLENMQLELKRAILSLTNENGLFYKPTLYSADAYVNPLFGLALIPLAQECVDTPTLKNKNTFHGILD